MHPRFKHPVGINLPFRLPSYLPVYCLILHQLFKPLLHCSLEDARLVSLLPKLSSESSLGQVQLQKHYEVWLWQSHIRLHAPVQAEALKKTKKPPSVTLDCMLQYRTDGWSLKSRINALTGLALVKATPEKAYLSTTRVMPCSSFFFIKGLWIRIC